MVLDGVLLEKCEPLLKQSVSSLGLFHRRDGLLDHVGLFEVLASSIGDGVPVAYLEEHLFQ